MEMFTRSAAANPQVRAQIRARGAALPYAEGIDPPSMAPKPAPAIVKPPPLPAPLGPPLVDYGEDDEERRNRVMRRAGTADTIIGGAATSPFQTYTSAKLGQEAVISNLFDKPQPVVMPTAPPPDPKPPAPMPDPNSPELREAERRARLAAMSRAGRRSTILTAPEDRANFDSYSASKLGSAA